ncbi:MAG: peptidylprolyl isomerase [Pseudomonadota bacterium]
MLDRSLLIALAGVLALLVHSAGADGHTEPTLSGYPQVLVDTSHGEFVIELEPARAPITVNNFVALVTSGFYEKTIFHRVMAGFVVQGGGHNMDYSAKEETPTIVNESGNGLSNQRGTIAMARQAAPHTANSQFYINLADNSRLDPREDRWGYTVFGRVISGMETLDRIASLPTGPAGPFASDVPSMPVILNTAKLLSDAEVEARAQAELEAAQKLLEEMEQP